MITLNDLAQLAKDRPELGDGYITDGNGGYCRTAYRIGEGRTITLTSTEYKEGRYYPVAEVLLPKPKTFGEELIDRADAFKELPWVDRAEMIAGANKLYKEWQEKGREI